MLLLGVLAAQAEAAAPAAAGSYDLLETEILTGSQASVTFSNLNSTYGADYQHLQIRMTTRSTRAGNTSDGLDINYNGDTGSNYAWHRLLGNGSSVSSAAGSSQTTGVIGVTSAASSTADSFSGAVLDILDPFETTKYTTARCLSGITSTSLIFLSSVLWMNTAALDSIALKADNGNLLAGCRFSLYGLKKAA